MNGALNSEWPSIYDAEPGSSWSLQLMDGRTVSGRLLYKKMLATGAILSVVLSPDGGDPIEVPFHAVMIIEPYA